MFKHASDVWGSIRSTRAHRHTGRYDTVSPTCVSALIQWITPGAYSVGGHLHVVIGSTCQGCRKAACQGCRREWVRCAGSKQPECHVLRLLFTHTCMCTRTLLRISDLLSWREVGLFSADWVIYLAVYFSLLMFVQHQRPQAKITEKVWTRACMQAFCLLYFASSCIPKDVIFCTIPTWKAPVTHAWFLLFLPSSEVVQLGWMCMQM